MARGDPSEIGAAFAAPGRTISETTSYWLRPSDGKRFGAQTPSG